MTKERRKVMQEAVVWRGREVGRVRAGESREGDLRTRMEVVPGSAEKNADR